MADRARTRWIRAGNAELGLGVALLAAGFIDLVLRLFVPGTPLWLRLGQAAAWVGLGLWASRRLTPGPATAGPVPDPVPGPRARGAALLVAGLALAAWARAGAVPFPDVVFLEGAGLLLLVSGVIARWRWRAAVGARPRRW